MRKSVNILQLSRRSKNHEAQIHSFNHPWFSEGEEMNHIQFVEFLEKNGACSEAFEMVKDKKWTMKQAWYNSPRADWMMWLYSKRKPVKKKAVMVAIYSARLSLKDFENKYPDDKRPRQAIEAAETVLKKDNKETRSAALSAARSAALSAARSAALSATLSAARSAALSAAWSGAESAAWSAAWSANHKLICEYIRKIIPILIC